MADHEVGVDGVEDVPMDAPAEQAVFIERAETQPLEEGQPCYLIAAE